VTVLEVFTSAMVELQIAANNTATPQAPKTPTIPIDSFTDRGSNRKKDGTAKTTVTPTLDTIGSMRRKKSESAYREAGKRQR
jgi:hypothetical protein